MVPRVAGPARLDLYHAEVGGQRFVRWLLGWGLSIRNYTLASLVNHAASRCPGGRRRAGAGGLPGVRGRGGDDARGAALRAQVPGHRAGRHEHQVHLRPAAQLSARARRGAAQVLFVTGDSQRRSRATPRKQVVLLPEKKLCHSQRSRCAPPREEAVLLPEKKLC